jgi:hypothetical protein
MAPWRRTSDLWRQGDTVSPRVRVLLRFDPRARLRVAARIVVLP